MAKKQEKKRKKKGMLNLIIKGAFLTGVVSSIVSIVSVQVTIADKKNELIMINEQIIELEQKNDEYQRFLNVTDEKAYMEKIAIEKLGYALPTERRFYGIAKGE